MDPAIIVMPALFALLGFFVWVIAGTWRYRGELRARGDLHTRLLDRIGSAKDFAELLSAPAGRELAQALLTMEPATNPDRAAQALQAGVVVAATSVGLLSIGLFMGFDDPAVPRVFIVLGVVGLSLGIGCLLSAAAAHWYAASVRQRG